ncbi:MAG: protease Lon-related BREX system protein BrxL [Oscillospiraceae bacterium]|nr:protease Lon-related BREX system protein BrxL [Oscillospiraceae bacterium]
MEEVKTDYEQRLKETFQGRIVRKDLTKKIKEGANVPVYVLEFLLVQYCSSDDPETIENGVATVKRILEENFVRPDEAQKVLSKLRSNGSHTVIDMVTVRLDLKRNTYIAEFSNLGVNDIPIADEYPEKFDRLLCGGIWCIVQLSYEYVEEARKSAAIQITKLTPIQMPHVDLEEIKQGRTEFTKGEWLDLMLRSIGMEPDALTYREKWLLLTRMLPLVENNFNLCELGPRSTGKSHLYKEISPNSILVSGGQTTVANLFYNMGRKTVGLVGLWDCVAFDEVAGIRFKDKDGVQIMKDYMASGSFARGKEEKAASASMVFVGNINQSVDVLLKTSSLFDPFPPEMGTDTAFLDRIHCYLPGWEIPKFRPEHFTNSYGFISDYLAEFIRELRKVQYGDALDKYFKLGKNLNQRDTIAVRRMVDGYLKLMYPNGEFTKDELEEILRMALEMRRRVKEQLKKLGGMEFYDVNFSYIDNETFEEKYVCVPEQGGDTLIPEGMAAPGQVYTISRGKSGMIGAFRLESQMLPGNGKFDKTGLGTERGAKEATDTAFNFLRANARRISGNISTTEKNYVVNYQDLQGIGMTDRLALPTVIALCSIALNRATLSSLVVLGDISIGGTLIKVDELANTLQACADCGAKKVLLPAVSMIDFATVPADLMTAFQLIPYQNAEDAVFKALGVE